MEHHKYITSSLITKTEIFGYIVSTRISVTNNVKHYESIRRYYFSKVHGKAVKKRGIDQIILLD